MKKLLYLLPLLLIILACGTQSQPTQNVSDIVNATLTAIAQDNLQVVTPQVILATITPPTVPSASLTNTPVPSPSAIAAFHCNQPDQRDRRHARRCLGRH